MSRIPVRSVDVMDASLVASVQETFGSHHTLADLLRWASAQVPRVHIAEIVTQDEYTHDVVVPFGPAFLNFDTT